MWCEWEEGGGGRENGGRRRHRKSQQSHQLTASPMHIYSLAALLLERKTLEIVCHQVLVTGITKKTAHSRYSSFAIVGLLGSG